MDKDKTLKVNWKEWREYHLLNPSGHSMHDIIQFWRHSSVSAVQSKGWFDGATLSHAVFFVSYNGIVPANSPALDVILVPAGRKLQSHAWLKNWSYYSLNWHTFEKYVQTWTNTRKHSPINIAICRVWIFQTMSEHIVELDTNSPLTFGNLLIIFWNLRMSSAMARNHQIIFRNKRQ